jgi:hypothetical protein
MGERGKGLLDAVLWTIIAVYAAVTLIPDAFPRDVSSPLILPVAVLLPAAFGLIHGGMRYGALGILVFLVLCLGISNIMENVGVMTGFPFGAYYYTDVMGPKLFLVPLLIGPSYFGTGYVSWMLAVILLNADGRRDRFATVAVPLVATFVMVTWDLCLDPSASTIAGMWIWENGGGYFGVPLTNYLGWFLTVFIFLLLFSLYRASRPDLAVAALPRGYWFQPPVMFAVMALDYLASYLGHDDVPVTDATGKVWQTGDIYETGALLGLFVMLAIAVAAFAVVRLRQPSRTGPA